MGKKYGFLVCELGYEYNDETNYRPESDGVIPQKLYMDEQQANDYAEACNIGMFEDITVMQYGYGMEELTSLSEDKFNELLKGIGTWEDFEEDYVEVSKLKKEDIKKVVQAFDRLRFYEVRKVEIDG